MKFDTLLKPDVGRRYARDGYWTGETITTYFEKAERRTPDKLAIVAPGIRMTYAELGTDVRVVEAQLASLNVGQGDVVSIQLPNCAEFVIVHLAASRLGAVTNPLLPNYRASELLHILGVAGSVVAVIPQEYRKFDYPSMYGQMQKSLPALRNVFVVGGEGLAGMQPFDALRRKDGGVVPRTSASARDPDEVTSLIFTSGTESKPKGVMHSHNTQMYGTVHMANLLGLTADDVVWTPSPVGHGTGFQWGVRQAITLGATLVLQDLWNADDALRLIARERCTFTLAATPFAAMLLDSPLIDQLDLSSFRIFACAGAAIPHKLGVDMRERVGCKVIGMWGMTECFVGSSSAPSDTEAKLWGTDGKAMPGCELAIFDEARQAPIPAGETGELAVRGPTVSLGYFNDPERTAATFSGDGWLFSGDLATMDGDGYIRLVGRKKEIINRGGLKISVRQMEEHLLSHPKIKSVAMVGVPDATMGEKSCAFVVTRDHAPITLADVTSYLDQCQVAKYKFPEYLVTMKDLPTTPSGKIQKYVLRDGFTQGSYTVITR